MALNLSTLTSPSNSSVLEEVNTTADFLESVPVFRNLSRSSNRGSDAKQDVALNQPRALPLIKNPQGKLGGYLYIPNVSGNYATGPSVTIGSNETWEAEVDMVMTQLGLYVAPMGGGLWDTGFGFIARTDGLYRIFSKGTSTSYSTQPLPLDSPTNIKYGFDGNYLYVEINGQRTTYPSGNQASSITHTLQLTQQNGLPTVGNYAIQKAKLTVNNAVVFDCDFNGSTSIRHGDTKFQASVGGPVSLTKAGNDPVTVVKKSVLRFDGANDFFTGLLGQSIDSGHVFVSFSWLGSGGDSWARPFGVHKTGELDYASGGFVLRRFSSNENLIVTQNMVTLFTHLGMVDSELGDMLVDFKVSSGDTDSKINNADLKTSSATTDTDASNFNIAAMDDGQLNAAIDLEFLALFSADSVPDEATASKIRDYINKRNNVFSLVDNGYYFFDPQKADFTGNFTDANTLDGYITGSDNGDTDVRSNLTLVQATQNDQPSTDGYTITFNDAAEHLEFENGASQNLSGWQICGTSLGTFAYRVQGAVTELNLLGNAGVIRTAGDSYGMILLPESATGADIEAARKLLIDRGAADGTTSSAASNDWYGRSDIVEFKHINTSSLTALVSSFRDCINLENFPALDLSNSNNFTSAWNGCSALQSFPAGAKLGTAANNVDFSSAWRDNGLTSFSTPLPTATTLSSAFRYCSSLSNFNLAEIPLVTHINTAFQSNSITSFNTKLPKVKYAYATWYGCTALTDFSADVFANWNPSSISTGVFNQTWKYCTLLTAQSVENILTSIDTSGQFATTTGASGGPALGDSGIDIDYNSDPLSAATNAAIDSLSGKGWEVFINGVLVIPNILDLQPAAAYSLRSFDADADPNVVNVRRSSDGALSNFKASEVSDGTLTTWVNTEYNRYTSDFSSDVDGWVSYLGTSTPNVDSIGGQDDCLRFVQNAENSYHFIFKTQQLLTDNRYRISAEVYLPSSNTQIDELKVVNAIGDFVNRDGSNSTTTTDEWVTISFEATRTTGGNNHRVDFAAYTNGTNVYQGNGTDTFYVRNVQIDQLTADGHVTTWYDQAGSNDASQTLVSSMPKLVDGGTLVTEGGLPALDFHTEVSNLSLDHSDLYGQATLDSYYVTKATGDQYVYPSWLTSGSNYGMVAQSGSGGNTSSGYGSPSFYANGSQITGSRGDIHTGTSGGQKLVAHIGAATTGSGWGAEGMNFGNFDNRTDYSYTGKLQEMIFFNTDQSSNRTGIENNINDTYTIY